MRITRRPTTTIPGLADAGAVGDVAGADPRTESGPVTDRVQLSEAARLRQRLKAEVGDVNEPTSDLQALAVSVTDQTYAPSPRAVAQKMLSDLAADLLA